MSRTLVEKQFGAHAAGYVTSPVHAKGASLQRLVELVRPEKHWQALDIATAAGHTALAFAPHVAQVTATDITAEMLVEAEKLARERGVTNITITRADAEQLPFTDGSFELVTCRIAAHHFPDVPRFVAEVWRVLKPGGAFALVDNISPDEISTPGFAADELRDAADNYNAFEKLRDPSHGRCLTTSEWRTLISSRGFTVEHVEQLSKEMDFGPWVERMGVAPEAVTHLDSMLANASPALQAFLKSRREAEKVYFTLHEILIVARKPG